MGGFFGTISKGACITDLFYGTDYNSHLGTRRGGMATYDKEEGFTRSIHNLENSYFRTKFEPGLPKFKGKAGNGIISDTDAQPIVINSHLGKFAIVTVAKINNLDELEKELLEANMHFSELSSGKTNQTELVALLITQGKDFVEGIENVYNKIKGSCSMLLLTEDGIIAARDKWGRTPIVIGKKDGAYAATSESSSLPNLDYEIEKFIGPGEIVRLRADGMEQMRKPNEGMQVCSFLWVYYGFPVSCYEGKNVEDVRFMSGYKMGQKDDSEVDCACGIPDSGVGMALGYAEGKGVPYHRAIAKYTPSWPRSFTPANQEMRALVAKMKLIPNRAMLEGRRILFCDDSIVRGTTMREIVRMARESGAKKVYVASSAPRVMYPNVYGIDMPTRSELICGHGASAEEVARQIGADAVIFQTVEGLKGALTDLNPNISRFDCSCFDGEYVTGDIDAAYLDKLEASRSKPAKPASKDDEE